MKTTLLFLISFFSSENSPLAEANRKKDFILKVAEEVAAWMLLGGFVLGVFWIAGILFSAQIS